MTLLRRWDIGTDGGGEVKSERLWGFLRARVEEGKGGRCVRTGGPAMVREQATRRPSLLRIMRGPHTPMREKVVIDAFPTDRLHLHEDRGWRYKGGCVGWGGVGASCARRRAKLLFLLLRGVFDVE